MLFEKRSRSASRCTRPRVEIVRFGPNFAQISPTCSLRRTGCDAPKERVSRRRFVARRRYFDQEAMAEEYEEHEACAGEALSAEQEKTYGAFFDEFGPKLRVPIV